MIRADATISILDTRDDAPPLRAKWSEEFDILSITGDGIHLMFNRQSWERFAALVADVKVPVRADDREGV